MAAEPRQLCTLRPGFDNLSLADQAALIENCHALDAEQYRRLEAKNAALVDHIVRQQHR
jgi:hypothetical protein